VQDNNKPDFGEYPKEILRRLFYQAGLKPTTPRLMSKKFSMLWDHQKVEGERDIDSLVAIAARLDSEPVTHHILLSPPVTRSRTHDNEAGGGAGRGG
jgi:hypothetical protein